MAQILINVRPVETRVAYVENEVLVDLKIERHASPTLAGSLHKGRSVSGSARNASSFC